MSESMMGTKYDLSEFDRGMIVGSLINSLTTDLLDFHFLENECSRKFENNKSCI